MLRTEKLGGDPDEDEDDEKDPYTGMYKVFLTFTQPKVLHFFLICGIFCAHSDHSLHFSPIALT